MHSGRLLLCVVVGGRGLTLAAEFACHIPEEVSVVIIVIVIRPQGQPYFSLALRASADSGAWHCRKRRHSRPRLPSPQSPSSRLEPSPGTLTFTVLSPLLEQ